MTQEQALSILKTGANVFLTGEPGSGKTHLVNEYARYLRGRKIEPAITASTGIAATHISGMTIHSWSGIGVRQRLDKYDLDRICSIERIVRRVENARVLIIDEISMLSADTLFMVDAVCREIRRSPDRAFGGLQAVFVGDFFQLPPVTREDRQAPQKFAYESASWSAAEPVVCYLTDQFRQEDQNFLGLLKAIRSNAFGEPHKQHIYARRRERQQVAENIPRFFPHNAEVNAVNEAMLEKLPGQTKVFMMTFRGRKNMVESLKKGCLSPEELRLKPGAAVMFTKNNSRAGFVNGTLGVVSGFDAAAGLPEVRLKSGRTVRVEHAEWTIEENGRVRAGITQIPLRLAWAITVHKSQGITLEEAAMDLTEVFEYGQGYVALSRVRRLSGLHLFGWNERTFQVHPEVLDRDRQFRSSSENAAKALAGIAAPELSEKHKNFILRCGGRLQAETEAEAAEDDLDTYGKTLALWEQGKSLPEIAKSRELKPDTILSHLERLSRRNKINKAEFSRLLTPALAKALSEIHAAFRELGADRLSPINEKFAGRYPYTALRIARMLYNG